MKIFRLLLAVLLLSSCGVVVNYDYEKTTDFSKYKTYNYYGDMNTGLSQLDTKRLLRALDAKLESIGLQLSDTPDFFIDIQSEEYESQPNSNVGVGVGGTGRNVGGGISVGLPVGQSNPTRRIVFDFVNENKGGLFWQAVSEGRFNPNASPEKREAVFTALVEKVLSKYPPKK